MTFKKLTYLIIFVMCVGFLYSRWFPAPDGPLFQSSNQLPEYQQASFAEYINDTRQWLQNNRFFLTEEKHTEIEVNMPFELSPEEKSSISKGILLVHGLGDSPFYLKDIAQVLVEQGFLVRTILLPGHGSRPADLLLPIFNDWEKIVEHHTELLAQQVDDVWLGGFSTGANLVTTLASDNETVNGLLLFSPALAPRDSLYFLAPLVNRFSDWLDIDPHENNYTRYATLATNGAALFSRSVKNVNASLLKKPYDKPVLIVISESDSVIDSEKVVELFKTKFTHPRSRLIWYGQEKRTDDSRIISLSSSMPEKRISTFSHMGVLFSPDNAFYGKDGSQLVCDNGQSEEAEKECPTSDNLWYSSFDYIEDGKIHARLTWNPYFNDLVETISKIIE